MNFSVILVLVENRIAQMIIHDLKTSQILNKLLINKCINNGMFLILYLKLL